MIKKNFSEEVNFEKVSEEGRDSNSKTAVQVGL